MRAPTAPKLLPAKTIFEILLTLNTFVVIYSKLDLTILLPRKYSYLFLYFVALFA